MHTIDTHAHFYPRSYLELIAEHGAPFGADCRISDQEFFFKSPSGSGGPLPLTFVEAPGRLEEMDQQGITVQALSLSQPMVYWADAALSHRLAQCWNDAASAMHQKYPDRFIALLTLPMLDPDRAIDELDRASQLPGIRGVYMGTNINQRDLSDPHFAPIFARIERLRLPIFLHPLQPAGEERLSRFLMHNSIGYPTETTIAACHLIFGGVLDRHPDLQVSLPHAGGVLPALIGRIDHSYHVSDAARRISSVPSEYLKRFTYDTITHSGALMEFVIALVGIERIMLGSDYCFAMGCGRPLKMIDELQLSSNERQMILSGNAKKLLKL